MFRHFKSGWLRTTMIAAAAACMLWVTGSANAQTAQLKVRGQTKYVHGTNVAWFVGRYSNDIGYNPFHPDWGTGYNGALFDTWLQDMDRMNVNVLRIWLFEGEEGLVFDSNGYASGIQADFLTNLDDLVARLNNKGLAAEFVFLNYQLGDEVGLALPNGATLKNIVADPAASAAFINNVVTPLATRYRGNLAVFSYDIMNEANLGYANNGWTWANLRPFVSGATSAIHAAAPGTQVTCSVQEWIFDTVDELNSKLGGLGLDYYEFHEYDTTPNLAAAPSFLDKPLLLGEYGPSHWTAANMNAAGTAYITQAKDRGYAGSMAWAYYNSAGAAENIANNPGGTQEWKPLGFTIQSWGTTLGTATGVTETDPPHSSNPLVIYNDALASGWVDSSWDTTFNYASTTQVQSGTASIMADSTAGWSALSISNAAGVSTSGYNYITFWVHGGNRGDKSITLALQAADGSTILGSYPCTAKAKAWTKISVKLSLIGNPSALYRMWWQNGNSSQIEPIYIDQVQMD